MSDDTKIAVQLDLKVVGALVFGGLTLFGGVLAFLLNLSLSAPKEALQDMSVRVSDLRTRQDNFESRAKEDLQEQRKDTNETLRAINQNLSALSSQVTAVQVKLGVVNTVQTPPPGPTPTAPHQN